jgi:hypothetical protein
MAECSADSDSGLPPPQAKALFPRVRSIVGKKWPDFQIYLDAGSKLPKICFLFDYSLV